MTIKGVDIADFEAVFPDVTVLFKKFSESHQLHVLTTAANKHGSIVWECGAASIADSLRRFIEFAITSDETNAAMHASVSLTVENDDAYTRLIEEQWQYHSSQDMASDVRRGELLDALRSAWKHALRLGRVNLTTAYPSWRRGSADGQQSSAEQLPTQ